MVVIEPSNFYVFTLTNRGVSFTDTTDTTTRTTPHLTAPKSILIGAGAGAGASVCNRKTAL